MLTGRGGIGGCAYPGGWGGAGGEAPVKLSGQQLSCILKIAVMHWSPLRQNRLRIAHGAPIVKQIWVPNEDTIGAM